MALVNCTECGREVSDKAVSCPSCGAPVSGPISGEVAAGAVPQRPAVQGGQSGTIRRMIGRRAASVSPARTVR
ncbi:MAG: zinc-ribbon domain-containing protein [Luteitalea sp.]|nr:zinc-ribbon domain-containing protein [Luteitalea sp.]